jgi:hypothetical protein
MPEPEVILDATIRRAETDITRSFIVDERMRSDINYVALNLSNRAGVRLLMACLLAKLHRPDVDIRKPYTEIGDPDVFSGRTYDERYITNFISRYGLPCNSTTAFLTPALRNHSATLTTDIVLVGKPPQLYRSMLNRWRKSNLESGLATTASARSTTRICQRCACVQTSDRW